MTADALKKLDKRLRRVADPLGGGFQIVRKIVKEFAARYEATAEEVVHAYVIWKWRQR